MELDTQLTQSQQRLELTQNSIAVHAGLMAELLQTAKEVGRIIPIEVQDHVFRPTSRGLTGEVAGQLGAIRSRNNLQIEVRRNLGQAAYFLTGRS